MVSVAVDDFGHEYIVGTEEYVTCEQRGRGWECDPHWVQSWYDAKSPEGEEINISFCEYPDEA